MDPKVQYPYLKEIRIWKCNARDEGARMVCEFLKINSVHKTPVLTCDMMGNCITSLGCEFFGQMLSPAHNTTLKVLKLDHNPIGWQGLAQLARGISQNATLNVKIFDCILRFLVTES